MGQDDQNMIPDYGIGQDGFSISVGSQGSSQDPVGIGAPSRGGGGGGSRGPSAFAPGSSGAGIGAGYDPADLILGTDGKTLYGYKRAYDATTGKYSYETQTLGDASTPAGQAAIAAATGLPAGVIATRFSELFTQLGTNTRTQNQNSYGQVLSALGNGQYMIENPDGTHKVMSAADAANTPGITTQMLQQSENERLYNEYRGNEAGFGNQTWDPTKLSAQTMNGAPVGSSGEGVFNGPLPIYGAPSSGSPYPYPAGQGVRPQGGPLGLPVQNPYPTGQGVAPQGGPLGLAVQNPNGVGQSGPLGLAVQNPYQGQGAMPPQAGPLGQATAGPQQNTNPLTSSGSSLTQPAGGAGVTPSGGPGGAATRQGSGSSTGGTAIFTMPKAPNTTTPGSTGSNTIPQLQGDQTSAPSTNFTVPKDMTNWQAGNLDTQLRQAQEFGNVNKYQQLTAGPDGSYSGTDFFGNHQTLSGDQVANSGSANAAQMQQMQQDYSQQQRQFGLQMRQAQSRDMTGYDPNAVDGSIAGVR